jgi:phage gp46-like protein
MATDAPIDEVGQEFQRPDPLVLGSSSTALDPDVVPRLVRGIDAELLSLGDGTYDFQISDDGDIKTAEAFDAAIITSLFTDARASQSEVSPSQLRRGWIGNESTPDFEIGSKLWLYDQARLTQNTVNGVIDAAQQSLQWLVSDSIPATNTTIAVSVSATAFVSGGTIQLEITIERPNSQTEKRYFELWQNTGVTLGA